MWRSSCDASAEERAAERAKGRVARGLAFDESDSLVATAVESAEGSTSMASPPSGFMSEAVAAGVDCSPSFSLPFSDGAVGALLIFSCRMRFISPTLRSDATAASVTFAGARPAKKLTTLRIGLSAWWMGGIVVL